MIELSNVSFSYNRSERPVLHDISFTVDKGEFVVLSGSTGTGKSTIIKLLDRQLSAGSGVVRVNGIDLGSLGRSAVAKYRRSIGCVLQDLNLLEDRTVGENLAFAMEVQGNRTSANKRDVIASTLERVGVHCDLNAFP